MAKHNIDSLLRLQNYFGQVISREQSRRAFVTASTLKKKNALDREHYKSSIAWIRSQIRNFLLEIEQDPESCIHITTSHKPGSLAAATNTPDITSHWLPIIAADDNEIRDFVEQEIPLPLDTPAEQIENLRQDRKTLRKRLNQKRRHDRAELSLKLGLVGGRTGNKRATPPEIEDRKIKNRNTIEFMNRMVIVGNDGEQLPMAEAAFTKKKKLSEIYTVLKGIQDHAEGLRMDWVMAVVTLPPAFHPNPTHGKSSWDGTLPTESRRRIGEGFTRIQDRCRKNKITVAGFWTVESHQDGCPHANFFIYSTDIEKVQEFFNAEFAVTDKSVKFKGGSAFEEGKPASFASYCTKYIMKGFSDEHAEDADVLGEEAWASAWAIRRLGFFGIPAREQWRRLRASTTPPPNPHPLLNNLWRAARGGRFGVFIGLMGGFGIMQKNRPLSTIHHPSKSGRSQVSVGVLLKDQELEARGIKGMGWAFITKKIGYWLIMRAENAPQPKQEAPTPSNIITFKQATDAYFSELHRNIINSAGYITSRVRLNYPSFAAYGLDREASPPWTLPPHRPGG